MAQATALRYEQSQGTTYVVKKGPLAQIYSLFDRNTINTGSEISAARIGDTDLQNHWFYTANVPLATKRKGKLLLGIGGREAFNAVFGQDIEAVCLELANTYYVQLNPGERNLILRLEHSGEVVFVDPKEMALKETGDSYKSFPIRTKNYGKDVTVPRMPFVGAGYGSGDMLGRVMDNLKGNNISETVVYTMNPELVAENVEDNEIVARASWLFDFHDVSGFFAGGKYVKGSFSLRGVLKNVAEGGTPESTTLEDLAGRG